MEYLWRFDWNISDEAIDKQIESKFTALMGRIGGALGTTVGGTTCALGMLYIYPQALMFVDEIGEELWEEIASAWTSVLNLGVRLAAQTIFLNGYKSVRNWLKKSGVATAILGEENAKKWGTSRNVVSMARTWQGFLKAIKPEWLQEFMEELAEEGYESCKEFALIVANRADQAIGIQRAGMKKAVLGSEKVIEIYPNREVKNEFTILAGREEIIRAQAVHVLADAQLNRNKDIGIVIGGGVPLEDVVRRAPRSITCIFEFSPWQDRPFSRPIDNPRGTGKFYLYPKYKVSNVKRTKLEWETLLLACGNHNGYMYGGARCTYYLLGDNNENKGRIHVFAGTEDEAKDRCEAFFQLTDCKLKSVTLGREAEGGNRTSARGNMKPNVRVYPTYVSIYAGVEVTGKEGRKTLSSPEGRSILSHVRFPLWTERKPYDFDQKIKDLLTFLSVAGG